MRLVIASVVIGLLGLSAQAQTPNLMNFQGQLATSGGDPANGSYIISFALYNLPTGGTAVWSENQNVQVTNGFFSVLLGSVNPIADTILTRDTALYLGVTVGSDPEMAPRTRLTAVPAAVEVGSVDGARGGLIDDGVFIGTVDTLPEFDTTAVLSQSSYSACPPHGYKELELYTEPDWNSHSQPGLLVVGNLNGRTVFMVDGCTGETWAKSYKGYKINIGDNNQDVPYGSSITGGGWNRATGLNSHVGGGFANRASGTLSTIGGGGMTPDVGYVIGGNSAGDFGTVGGGYGNSAGDTATTVGGGVGNYASGFASTIAGGGGGEYSSGVFNHRDFAIPAGGDGNLAPGDFAFVGGGSQQNATGFGSTVTGGWGGLANDSFSVVGGGLFNRTLGAYGVITGGARNVAEQNFSIVGGGDTNRVVGAYSRFGAIVGGSGNTVWDSGGFIGGGQDNSCYGAASVITGGTLNVTDQATSVIGGGRENEAHGTSTTIGGGYQNDVTGTYATITGGGGNQVNGAYSNVGGGSQNSVTGESSSIGGGTENYISGDKSVIPGGWRDTVEALYAYVAGGRYNRVHPTGVNGTIVGGYQNDVTGGWGTVLGGSSNRSGGYISYAFGRVAFADHDHSVVWNCEPVGGAFTSTSSSQFLIKAPGGVGIGTNAPTEQLDVVGNIHCSGTLTTGNSVSIDGVANTITSSSDKVSFVDDTIHTAGYLWVEGGGACTKSGTSSSGIQGFGASGSNSGTGGSVGGNFYAGGTGSGIHAGVVTNAASSPTDTRGVWASSYATAGVSQGLFGFGEISSGSGQAIGSYASSNNLGTGLSIGARGIAAATSGDANGGYFTASRLGGAGNVYGVFASATSGGGTNYGIYASAINGTTNWAGYFSGNVHVAGTLSKSAGSFKIDHPLDPENKWLQHSFVESPDMMNIYNGNVTTDSAGFATVDLPEYFAALNRDFRYQLTVIGQFAQAIIAREVEGNQFRIQTDKPLVRVSWTITGIRQDQYAKDHPVVVESSKSPEDLGHRQYLSTADPISTTTNTVND